VVVPGPPEGDGSGTGIHPTPRPGRRRVRRRRRTSVADQRPSGFVPAPKGASQEYQLVNFGSDGWKVQSVDSGKCIDIPSATTAVASHCASTPATATQPWCVSRLHVVGHAVPGPVPGPDRIARVGRRCTV